MYWRRRGSRRLQVTSAEIGGKGIWQTTRAHSQPTTMRLPLSGLPDIAYGSCTSPR